MGVFSKQRPINIYIPSITNYQRDKERNEVTDHLYMSK